MTEKLERIRESANQTRGGCREFSEGSRVLVKGLRPGDARWLEGTVLRRVSISTYVVSTGGEERYVHADDLRPCTFQEGPRYHQAPECELPDGWNPMAHQQIPLGTPDWASTAAPGELMPVPVTKAVQPASSQPSTEDTVVLPPATVKPIAARSPTSADQASVPGLTYPEARASEPERDKDPQPVLRRSTRKRQPPERYKP